jgi:translation initiation factor 4A
MSQINNENEVYASFDHMDLDTNLLRGIYAYGFETPSSIQQKAIVPYVRGNEIIAQAQSGTGKTGAFSIALLQNLAQLKNKGELQNTCQAIVLLPTRDLANQVKSVIESLGEYLRLGVMPCVGGTKVSDDIRELRRNKINIVVGTPGRIYDLLCRKDGINGNNIKYLIIDEADEMLDINGFQDITHDILVKLPPDIQIGLYSATLPQSVMNIADKFIQNPVKIIVKQEELTLEGIKQYYIAMDNDNQKYLTLCDLYRDISINTSVIFCNHRNQVEWLAKEMGKDDFAVSCIYGTLPQYERSEIMRKFRNGETRVLITTDLLARGIDVQSVSIVINYDLPNSIENYLHRIGRSGRYGRKGLAINFVTHKDMRKMREIENFYETQIDELPANVSDLMHF